MSTSVSNSGHLDYFGRLSWGNLFDWFVTVWLGVYVALTTVLLGGVRPETQLRLLPVLIFLIVLHGIWFAVEREEDGKRMNAVLLSLVPFLGLVALSVFWWTPYPWLGAYELIQVASALAVLWLLVNNVRTRAHLWLFLILALAPAGYAIFIACYQFFQDPTMFAEALTEYGVEPHAVYLGRATGSFADPGSFALFALGLLPVLSIAAAVPRLPKILRVLALYLLLMVLLSLLLAQVTWALGVMVFAILLASWFACERVSRRLLMGVGGSLAVSGIAALLILAYPRLGETLRWSDSGGIPGVRGDLWSAALSMLQSSPLLGVGAGAYPVGLEQGDAAAGGTALGPHNAYLLILSEYGVLGLLLLGLPVGYVVWEAYRQWRREPYSVRLQGRKGRIMTPQRFFLSLGLAGFLTLAAGACFHFALLVPALTVYGLIFLAILFKSGFRRRLRLPGNGAFRLGYLLIALAVAWGLYAFAAPRLQSRAHALYAEQRLEQLIDARVHLSGNVGLLDEVLENFELAVEADPGNADAWIGLSSVLTQRLFRNPDAFDRIGGRAVEAAERAIALSDAYWRAWAQLGMAQAYLGEADGAERALARALELAPNSSNANYYWAAFASHFPERHEEAVRAVDRALEIDPDNAAARRLQQKLRIL